MPLALCDVGVYGGPVFARGRDERKGGATR